MMIGVVAHRVPFLDHPFDQLRAGLEVVADQEETGLGIMCLQRVQNGRGVAVFKTRVKGQIDRFLFARLAARRGRADKIA